MKLHIFTAFHTKTAFKRSRPCFESMQSSEKRPKKRRHGILFLFSPHNLCLEVAKKSKNGVSCNLLFGQTSQNLAFSDNISPKER